MSEIIVYNFHLIYHEVSFCLTYVPSSGFKGPSIQIGRVGGDFQQMFQSPGNLGVSVKDHIM